MIDSITTWFTLAMMAALAAIVVLLFGAAALEAMCRAVPVIVGSLWRSRGWLADWIFDAGSVIVRAMASLCVQVLGFLWDAVTSSLARLLVPPAQRFLAAVEARRAMMRASRAAVFTRSRASPHAQPATKAPPLEASSDSEQEPVLPLLDVERAYAMLGLERRDQTTKAELNGRYSELVGRFPQDEPRHEALLDMFTAARDIVRRARGWR